MKKLNQGWRYFIIAICVGLLAILVIGFNSRMAELRRLSAQAEQVSVQVEVLKQTQMVLEAQIAYATSDIAVEEWAYEDAHMIREGDYPIVLIPSVESTPEASLEIESTQSEVRNWQVWLALFFDPDSP
jgi:cell division protein FtsB